MLSNKYLPEANYMKGGTCMIFNTNYLFTMFDQINQWQNKWEL